VAGGLTPISGTGQDLQAGQCKIGLIVPNFLSRDRPTMQVRRVGGLAGAPAIPFGISAKSIPLHRPASPIANKN